MVKKKNKFRLFPVDADRHRAYRKMVFALRYNPPLKREPNWPFWSDPKPRPTPEWRTYQSFRHNSENTINRKFVMALNLRTYLEPDAYFARRRPPVSMITDGIEVNPWW